MKREEARQHVARLLRVLVVTGAVYAAIRVLGYFAHLGNTQRHHVESALLILVVLAGSLLAALRGESRAAVPTPVRTGWTVPICVGISLALYGHALALGYISDDYVLAHAARQGHFLTAAQEFVRPVPLLVWRMIFAGGGGPAWLHLFNVALHGFNGALTVMLARHLGLGRRSAAIAGIIFVVWPTQVEPVAWAAGIFDVSMTCLVLLAACVYLDTAPLVPARRTIGIVGLTILALLSKESALALPALLGIVSVSRWESRQPTRSEIVMLLAVTVTCSGYFIWRAFLRLSVIPFAWPEITRYALKEQVSRSFGSLAVPLSADTIRHAPWLAVCLGVLAVGPAIWTLVSSRQRVLEQRIAVQGLLWALGATLPAIGYLYVANSMLGSRFVYLSAVGWAIFLAAVAEQCSSRLRGGRVAQLVFATMLVAMAMPQTAMLLSDWRAAATLRDRLLGGADRVAADAGCSPDRVVGVPETLRGAHLFENGFLEALGSLRTQAGSPLMTEELRHCTLRWNEGVFVAEFP